MIIRRLLGALRLTTSGFSSQSLRQAKLACGIAADPQRLGSDRIYSHP